MQCDFRSACIVTENFHDWSKIHLRFGRGYLFFIHTGPVITRRNSSSPDARYRTTNGLCHACKQARLTFCIKNEHVDKRKLIKSMRHRLQGGNKEFVVFWTLWSDSRSTGLGPSYNKKKRKWFAYTIELTPAHPLLHWCTKLMMVNFLIYHLWNVILRAFEFPSSFVEVVLSYTLSSCLSHKWRQRVAEVCPTFLS